MLTKYTVVVILERNPSLAEEHTYTRYSCSFTLSSSCPSPNPGICPTAPTPSLPQSLRSSGGIVPAPFYAYPLGQIGGVGRSLVVAARRRRRPPFGSWHPIIIVFALGRRETPRVLLGRVTIQSKDRYIHLHGARSIPRLPTCTWAKTVEIP